MIFEKIFYGKDFREDILRKNGRKKRETLVKCLSQKGEDIFIEK